MNRISLPHLVRQIIPRLRVDPGHYSLTQSHRGPWLQLITPHNFVWTGLNLQIVSLPPALEGFRILHLSDLHFHSFWAKPYDELLQAIRNNPPDLILITGDFVENRFNFHPAMPTVARFLGQLASRFGIFGICGNHDNGRLARQLRQYNIPLLDNKRQIVPVKDCANIELIGAMQTRKRRAIAELNRPLPDRPANSVRLFMSHYPDCLPLAQRWTPDLFLAGHTHGGQICLPGGIPIIKHCHLPRKFCRGIYRMDDTWVIISRGFGYTDLPMRLFCPAEVIEITLTKEELGTPSSALSTS